MSKPFEKTIYNFSPDGTITSKKVLVTDNSNQYMTKIDEEYKDDKKKIWYIFIYFYMGLSQTLLLLLLYIFNYNLFNLNVIVQKFIIWWICLRDFLQSK